METVYSSMLRLYIYNKEEVQFSGSYTESSATRIISTTAFVAHSCTASKKYWVERSGYEATQSCGHTA